MIFQQFNLVPRLDVLTNVLAGRLNRIPTARALLKLFTARERALAIRALDRLGIADLALNRADALSGGQQQRVAIARALMQEPRLLLADEPIASLDPMNAKLVMDALRDINRRDGITVLCNLHTLDTARAYCDRIVGMAQGRIVFDGRRRRWTRRRFARSTERLTTRSTRASPRPASPFRARCRPSRAPDPYHATGEISACFADLPWRRSPRRSALALPARTPMTSSRNSASAFWAARTRRIGWRATTSSRRCCRSISACR